MHNSSVSHNLNNWIKFDDIRIGLLTKWNRKLYVKCSIVDSCRGIYFLHYKSLGRKITIPKGFYNGSQCCLVFSLNAVPTSSVFGDNLIRGTTLLNICSVINLMIVATDEMN